MKKIGVLLLITGLFYGCADKQQVEKELRTEQREWFESQINPLEESVELLNSALGFNEDMETRATKIKESFLVLFSEIHNYQNSLSQAKWGGKGSLYDSFTDRIVSQFKQISSMADEMRNVSLEMDSLTMLDRKFVGVTSTTYGLILAYYSGLIDQINKRNLLSIIDISMPDIFEERKTISFTKALPYLERSIGIKLSLVKKYLERNAKTHETFNVLSQAFEKINSNMLKLNYEEENTKAIWISKEINSDDLKLGSVLYAFHKWESLLGQSLFDFKGVLPEEAVFGELDGKNAISMRSSLGRRSIFSLFEKRLGTTRLKHRFEESDIDILKDSDLSNDSRGYCYESGIYDYLPENSIYKNGATGFGAKLCTTDDERYNFVEIVLHELGHYLGYEEHSDNRSSIMYKTLQMGSRDYNLQEAAQLIKTHNPDLEFN